MGGEGERERGKADNVNLLHVITSALFKCENSNNSKIQQSISTYLHPQGHHSHYYMQYMTELSLFENHK